MIRTVTAMSILGAVLSLSTARYAYAQEVGYAGADPNVVRYLSIPDYRRAAVGDKYLYSKRRIQQFDDFTTASGSTTFDHRASYLRATQLRRIQEDFDARVWSGPRQRPYYLPTEGQSRFENTIQRRISEAKSQGGIRLRSETRAAERMNRKTAQEKQAEVNAYRNTVREAEQTRLNPVYDNLFDCFKLARRRQAMCLYKQRADQN